MSDDKSPRIEVDAELIRRQHARLRLGIPARFETLDERYEVRLVNLSQGGAQIVLPRPDKVAEGVLSWMKYETFGIVVWQDEANVGLEFDRPLSADCLRATHEFAPDLFREIARDFVQGNA